MDSKGSRSRDSRVDMDRTAETRRKRKLWIAFAALMLVFALSLSAILWMYFGGDGFDADKYKSSSDSSTDTSIDVSSAESESESVVYAQNPIDFASLQEKNADVCAWITVPNTSIDYPIVQSSKEDDDYYINHAWEGNYTINGAIYIQRLNGKYFTDRNTVVYGHNLRNGTMFRHLHKFRDKDFFDANEYFYIYTPGHILTYRIFSAYRYDNRHILNSFDFADTAVYADYLQYATDPNSLIKNVREGVEVTTDDKIVTLSTCISDKRYRYLVQGVQISDELTY